ncbi:hypothetical protein PCH_Pc16g02740 [Penicillium rubens Wisconsin 54-1255]|uniref:Uncharacterized protein n=1 Tax=Penicillium rubens (strain ATCC 28089 / DSM 1075 / NRRL 1951 / Wisconsin 54-1255) TaxID=500485 RepID=B6H7I8_PENRW|nr:hypothetical protein PCH_Pc16g02740 [Penicillium rubens Wisconsin 54-1255]
MNVPKSRNLFPRVQAGLYTYCSAGIVGFARPRKEKVLVPQRFSNGLGAGGGILYYQSMLLGYGPGIGNVQGPTVAPETLTALASQWGLGAKGKTQVDSLLPYPASSLPV